MRNNEDRFAAQPPESTPMPMNASNLDFVVPTELVALPSKGMFYPEDHPLHGKEFVEIKHMTAKEEDILTSASLLEKGVVLEYLVQSLLIDKRINPASLLPGDQNAILVSARINAYGPEYSFNFECDACGAKTTATADLTELENKTFSEDDVSPDGSITLFLEKSQRTVRVRHFTNHLNKLMDKEYSGGRNAASYGTTTTFLKFAILSIDNIPNDGSLKIMNFLENLPSRDVATIKKFYANNVPDVDFTAELVCSNCSNNKEGSVPITANFFWPDA